MARNRTIKPEFWTSEQVTRMSRDARLLWIGIWCFSDDQGVHPEGIRRLKNEVFPCDDDMTIEVMATLVEEMKQAGLLDTFEAEGERYWFVPSFRVHQRPEKPTCKYPAPPSEKCKRGVPNQGRRRIEPAAPPAPKPKTKPSTPEEPPPPAPPAVATKIDPAFDPAIDDAWERLARVFAEHEPGKSMRRTPKRTWGLAKALDPAEFACTPEELEEGARWVLGSSDPRAENIRNLWNGVDTFLADPVKYLELAKSKREDHEDPLTQTRVEETQRLLEEQQARRAQTAITNASPNLLDDDEDLPPPVKKTKKTKRPATPAATDTEELAELQKLTQAMKSA